VLAFTERDERRVADQRILGDGEFEKRSLSGMNEVGRDNFRLAAEKINQHLLVEKVSKRYEVFFNELRSGSQRNEIIEAR
jgi:chromosomal replication initiation ATPase DnaA